MAEALRVLMPSTYRGRPLTLYRGTHGGEHHKRQYGFSWTTDADTARKFAENWAQSFSGYSGDGVILKTRAPGKAILLVRRPEDYYDEGEVVVDPFRLGQVEVVERLCLPGRADWARPNQLI